MCGAAPRRRFLFDLFDLTDLFKRLPQLVGIADDHDRRAVVREILLRHPLHIGDRHRIDAGAEGGEIVGGQAVEFAAEQVRTPTRSA